MLEKGRAPLRRHHLRWRIPRVPPLRRYFFLLDCSASMVGGGALARAKGCLAGWLRPLRRERAQVALVCFGGGRAEVRFGPGPLPDHRVRGRNAAPRRESGHGSADSHGRWPTRNGNREWDEAWHADWIEPIGGGGGTPLALGLAALVRLRAARESRDAPDAATHDILVVLSDGRTAERPPAPTGFERIVLIDFETRRIALHGCAALAAQWSAEYMPDTAHLG
ncbi:MAG: vWA domain-containing protein [Janthinobacterium lividum]